MSRSKNSRALRGKAVRAVAGGLLMSSLSDDELKKLADELDLEFLEDLRELLHSLPLRSNLYGEEPREVISYGSAGLVDAIYDRAKSRRLSKDRVTGYMREIDPRIFKDFSRSALPLRELIREFIVLGSPANANRLLGLVSGQLEQDPYLTGITARR